MSTEVNAMIIRVTKEQFLPRRKRGSNDVPTSSPSDEGLEEVLVDYWLSEEYQGLRKSGFMYWYARHRGDTGMRAPGENRECKETPYTTSSLDLEMNR
jgi:hypothetical protein